MSRSKNSIALGYGDYEFNSKDNSFKATIKAEGTLVLDGHLIDEETLVVKVKSSDSSIKDSASARLFTRARETNELFTQLTPAFSPKT